MSKASTHNHNQMNKLLMREILSCFLTKSHQPSVAPESQVADPSVMCPLLDQDIASHLLEVLVSQNLQTLNILSKPDSKMSNTISQRKGKTEQFKLDSAQAYFLDEGLVCTCLNALELLGFIQQKKDSSFSTKWYSWKGFAGFRDRFHHLLSPKISSDSSDQKMAAWQFIGMEAMRKHEKFASATFIDKLLQELFGRLLSNDSNVVFKEEVAQLKSRYLYGDCRSELEKTNANKMFKAIKRYLYIIGFFQKTTRATGQACVD
mmetsp:Transcript_2046/g.3062  ORF Transcript_2046/g.3062 Transcript_2046/m.3062 type:complete len:262 (+) Transcript_2046:2-787(+)